MSYWWHPLWWWGSMGHREREKDEEREEEGGKKREGVKRERERTRRVRRAIREGDKEEGRYRWTVGGKTWQMGKEGRGKEREGTRRQARERCLRGPSREGKSKGVSGGEERSLRGQLWVGTDGLVPTPHQHQTSVAFSPNLTADISGLAVSLSAPSAAACRHGCLGPSVRLCCCCGSDREQSAQSAFRGD